MQKVQKTVPISVQSFACSDGYNATLDYAVQEALDKAQGAIVGISHALIDDHWHVLVVYEA